MSDLMKMVMIIYNEALDMETMEVLGRCAVKNYTKIEGIYGKGTTSGTHFGTDIWPGRNNILYVACEKTVAEQIFLCVKELRKKLGRECIKGFMWSLDALTE